MVQQRTEIIDLCDSGDDMYQVHHQASGRDQDDAICLSSDDEDSIAIVDPRPANDESLVPQNKAEISEGSRVAQPDQVSNVAPNVEAAAARRTEETQQGNPVVRNEEATCQPQFPPLNVTVQGDATLAQANTNVNEKSSQLSGGFVGGNAAANKETTMFSRGAAASNPVRPQFHGPDTAIHGSPTVPPASKTDLPSRTPKRPMADQNLHDSQNQIKSEVKVEEARTPAASRSQPSTNEEENNPESDSSAKPGDESERNVHFGRAHPRRKRVARKSVARLPVAELDDAKSEEQGDDDESYVEYLLTMRMRRQHGGNHKGSDSPGDDSDDSSFDAIPNNAYSSPNSGTDPSGLPNSPHRQGVELPVNSNNRDSGAVEVDISGKEEGSMLQQVILIPPQNNRLHLQGEQISQDVSDLSSVEQKAEGGIEKRDEDRDENDSMSTGSLQGPIEQSHRPVYSRRRRIFADDEESSKPIEIGQSSDGRPVSESDDSSFADLPIDKEFQGGKDKMPNLRKKEKLEKIASEGCMGKIDHLCSLGIDKETSLPTYKFSVHNADETIIYDFDVRVGKSKIPNAGRGVFLQFKGARELKPSRKDWGRVRKSSVRGLPEPLPAIYPHGMDVTVNLKGEGFPDPPKKIRIGDTRIYTESDYVPAPRRTFSSLHPKCGGIELGQYGPFRPEDRKTEHLFELKGFIFSQIPNEWGFDVPEKLDGETQMIDITDEVTGDTHEAARQHIPMYVNEVGHTKLKQTVCALDKEERNVVYYIVIREPMQPGETIELLVRYDVHYEVIRERKGYGKKNMTNKTKSDDHFGTFLERDSVERKSMKDQIVDYMPSDIGKMMGWFLSTHSSLSEVVNNFLVNAKPTAEKEVGRKMFDATPLAQQIVALRRFEWIAKLFEQNLKRLKEPSGSTTTSDLLQRISKLKWSKWNDLIVVLGRLKDIKDSNGKSLQTAFEREVVSELWYDMGDNVIKKPMVEGLWCSLAMSLTKDVCVETAKEIWQRKAGKSSLMQVYVQLAKDAVREIRSGNHLDTLSFVPNFKGDLTGLPSDAKQLKSIQRETEGEAGEVLSIVRQSNTIEPLESTELLAAIPKALAVDSAVQINQSWYICWQVLYVIDSFARTYLRGTTYTFDYLCDQICIGPDAKATMKAALAKRYEAQKSRAKKRQASFSSPGAQKTKKRSKTSQPGASARKMFFWHVTWKHLKEQCGWRLERGNRPGDFYAFPPGVTRKNGSNRTHFFDSVKQIRDKITQDETWKENPAVKSALVEEEKCSLLYTQLKSTKSLPNLNSKEELIEWIRSKVKNNKT